MWIAVRFRLGGGGDEDDGGLKRVSFSDEQA